MATKWFLLGFVLGCLLIFSETFGIVGYLGAIFVLAPVAVFIGMIAGPLAWLTLFLVIPVAAAINGLMVGTIFWIAHKLVGLINK